MPDEIRLQIGGRRFGGWKTARVTISMEAGSGSFDLSVSEKWPGEPARREIRPGDACDIWIGTQQLVTGYVDEVTRRLDATSHEVSIRGRDRVADLIDCAPDIDDGSAEGVLPFGVARGQWRNISLLDLARELSSPFGVEVVADASVSAEVGKLFEMVTMNPGQRVFELIEQQCRYLAVLPLSDGHGRLVLTRASTSRIPTPLVEGQNILACSAALASQDRFSRYIVKGQSFDFGTRGEIAGAAAGYATDEGIKRHRPLLLTADQSADTEQCQQRARYESLTRAARGARLSISVAGWRQPGGSLWPVNALATVQSSTLGVSGDFLVTQVSYSLPSIVTELELVRPDAFLVPPATTPPEDFLEASDDG